jgi:hypothetical protein
LAGILGVIVRHVKEMNFWLLCGKNTSKIKNKDSVLLLYIYIYIYIYIYFIVIVKMFELNDFTRKLSWKNSGVLLVVPLDLAITPMRVLQDPLIGPECRSMFEEGEVDDRFLMILFLMLERLRNNSSWKPYASITLAYFWVRFFFFRVVWVYSVYIVLGTLTCFSKPLEIHSGLLMMSFWS